MTGLKRISITLVLLVFTTALLAQDKTSNSVKKIVREIAAHNIYESKHIGIAGVISDQYQRFENLMVLASNKQLLSLAATDTNAVVRLYCYQALKARKAAIPANLSMRFTKDQSVVETLNGCISYTQPVYTLFDETIYIKPVKKQVITQ